MILYHFFPLYHFFGTFLSRFLGVDVIFTLDVTF